MSNSNLGPVDSDGTIPLSTILRATTDNRLRVSSVSDLDDRAPTEGRVAEVTDATLSSDEEIYVADGDQWLPVDSESGGRFGSVNTDEITVGPTGPVTGIVGDSDDWEHILTARSESGQASTTSTTFTNAFFDFGIPWDEITAITGYDQFAVTLLARGTLDTSNETMTARVSGSEITDTDSETQISTTGNISRHSGFAVASSPSGVENYAIEHKVTGGTGTLKRPVVHVWGQIA